jgi:hydrogenase expression/formation protein HypC
MCLGIPGKIIDLRIERDLPMGIVDFGGVRRDACLAYVADEVQVGDYVIVHVGFAISKVDEAEANRTFEVLREMSQLDELEWMADVVPSEARDPGSSSTGAQRAQAPHVVRGDKL